METTLETSSLATKLRERILRGGPISFRDWMASALYDPELGYYCRADRKRWGREGDYRTSPELCSLFPGTFARYFGNLYEELGRPRHWTILEVGSGEGVFAAGVLKTLRAYWPEVFAATTYVIDEISPASRELAAERLREFRDRVRFESLSRVEINPGVVFTNEFLDALPIHSAVLEQEMSELFVGLDEIGRFVWKQGELAPELVPRVKRFLELSDITARGQSAEVCLDAEDWLNTVAEKMRRGYVVTVDYGVAGASGTTLRGFKRHQFVDELLAQPGEIDITASVNWDFVKSFGAQLGLETVDFQRQDQFLLAAGLLEQLELESTSCRDEAERLQLSTSAREMILPEGMSTHFQVLVQRVKSKR